MKILGNLFAASLRGARLRVLAFASIVFLPQVASAAYEVYVAPKFMFNTVEASWAGPFYDTAEEAFVWAQNKVAGWKIRTNMRPMPSYGGVHTITYNGVYYLQLWDDTICQASNPPSCSTSVQGYIQTSILCPQDFSGMLLNTDFANRQMVCVGFFPDAEEPPEDCDSCVGNPIYVATGLKVQRETDYAGPSGLSYVRTYRSKTGFFGSVTAGGFLDLSAAALTTSDNCYPSSYRDPNTTAQVSKCFAYISSGQPKYRLATSAGRFIRFSGPNNAVVASADINDRVTRISTASGDRWRVRRAENSLEW